MRTGLLLKDVLPRQEALAGALYREIPAGVGSKSSITLDSEEMEVMLAGGAHWAVARGWGGSRRTSSAEDGGCIAGADPESVSDRAKERQRREMGTLGSGNHYLEVQFVAEIFDAAAAAAFGLEPSGVVVAIHCGSRGLGHQIATEFAKEMVVAAQQSGIALPDRDLACAPIASEVGRRYLGAMRAAMNCALANREILSALTRGASSRTSFPIAACRCCSTFRTTPARSRRISSTDSRAPSSSTAKARPAPFLPATRACRRR